MTKVFICKQTQNHLLLVENDCSGSYLRFASKSMKVKQKSIEASQSTQFIFAQHKMFPQISSFFFTFDVGRLLLSYTLVVLL